MTEKGRNAAGTDVLLQGGRRGMWRRTGTSALLWPGQLLFCFLLHLPEGTGGWERAQREPGMRPALRAALRTDCASVITALLLHSLATPNYTQG